MSDGYDIRLIKRARLETDRWDACVTASPDSRIYARSVYLDHMAAHWDALVLGDYEAVMPLTWKRKWFLRYAYQPAFVQQLGIFSRQAVSPELVAAFLAKAERTVRFAEITLNAGNPCEGRSRKNYVLSLEKNYEAIRANFGRDLPGNLKKSAHAPLAYASSDDPAPVIANFARAYGRRLAGIGRGEFARFARLCAALSDAGLLAVRQVSLAGSGKLLAAAIFFRDDRRLYNIMPYTSAEGRKRSAMHFLLDQVIREWAGTPTTLDFEGSEVPGIASFYSQFGGEIERYPFVRFNRLPWAVRWLKPDRSR